MSSTRINAALQALQEVQSQVIASRGILLLELEAQGWKKDRQFTGGWCLPKESAPLYMLDSEIFTKLTNDSTDANYIHMITHLLRNGWFVANKHCDLQHPDCGGPMPAREALLACITVATGN